MGRNHLHDDVSVPPDAGIGHRIALQVVPWLVLVAIWVALWGDPSPGTILSGAVLAALVLAVTDVADHERLGRFRPLAALRFFLYVLWSLVKATSLVAWEVLTPTNQIREGIIAVPLPSATPAVVTLVVGAIGLTPGTVVVEIQEDPCVLYVHVLHLRDTEAVRAELAHLEALALAAFGPADAGPDIVALEQAAAALRVARPHLGRPAEDDAVGDDREGGR